MSVESWEDVLERKGRVAGVAADNVIPLHAVEAESLLPDDRAEFQAASRPANKEIPRLVCILGGKEFRPGGKPYRAFQYMHLDSNAEFGYTNEGQEMRFRFVGLTPLEITVRGRSLLRIFDYIQLHRIAWIREADRDFEDNEATDQMGRPLPIITSIVIGPAPPSN